MPVLRVVALVEVLLVYFCTPLTWQPFNMTRMTSNRGLTDMRVSYRMQSPLILKVLALGRFSFLICHLVGTYVRTCTAPSSERRTR